MKAIIACPKCRKEYRPYGAFTLEKCYCPNCGNIFHILKGALIIKMLYSITTFIILIVMYDIVRPETSIVIAMFWIGAILLLKILTYITHIIIWVTWSMLQRLHKNIH